MEMQYILNMSASNAGSIVAILLTAFIMRACNVGVCVTLSRGFTLSR